MADEMNGPEGWAPFKYTDRYENVWEIGPAEPVRMAVHPGKREWGWKVRVTTPGGTKGEHQDPNLAQAVAAAAEMAGVLQASPRDEVASDAEASRD